MGNTLIYLDANASSRLRPCVDSLFASAGYGNPSSVHRFGRLARSRLQEARTQVANALTIGRPECAQVIFTSGATEACNAMLSGFLGGLGQLSRYPGHIICSAIEHPAILEPMKLLESLGWRVSYVLPNTEGIVESEQMIAQVCKETALITLMAANNESGALQPVSKLALQLRAQGYQGVIVSDFTQAFGKTLISAADLFESGVNAIAVSGHKIGAPSGIGALVLAQESGNVCFNFQPLILGGPQEGGYRGGTENIQGTIAFGEVCRRMLEELVSEVNSRRKLRDYLWQLLSSTIPDISCLTPVDTVEDQRSLCNTLYLNFSGCRGDDVVVALDLEGVAVSTGSACASGKQGISHVARAMGLSAERAREVVRFSLDWDTEIAEIEQAATIVKRVIFRMRELQSVEQDHVNC